MKFPESISRRGVFLSLASVLPASRGCLLALQDTKFSADVKVVNLLATVRDKHGQLVRTLDQDDFLLEEDGRPQTIRYFARETDLPLVLGLMVDTSGSQRRVLDEERDASHAFLEQVLREDKDATFIAHFDREIAVLQEQTSSREKLEAALALLEVPMQDRGGGQPAPVPRGQRNAGTLLYDAVVQISGKLMQPQQGRKAFIVLSDGVDNGSQQTLGRAIKASLVADTLIYSILFADPHGYGGGNRRGPGGGGRWGPPRHEHIDGKTVLQLLSKETGGGFFEVTKTEPLSLIYLRIQEELRNQYSVGYTPDRVDISAGYHKIRLTVRKKGMVVRTRDGYYAGQ
jgi:VWFA-related protein